MKNLLLTSYFFILTIVTSQAQSGQHVEVNGARLYYEVSGKGQPVVLIHGFTLDSRMWAAQRKALSKHFHVIAYDVRGFGRSSRVASPYDPAADLAALLDHLKIEKAHIVGLSMGANIALNFAVQYPSRVLKVVAADPNLDGFTEYTPELFGAFGQVFGAVAQQGWGEEAQRLWLQIPLFRLQNSSPRYQALLQDMVRAYNGDQFINPALAPNYGQPPTLNRLETIAAPVLVLIGEKDEESIQRIARLVAQKTPQAQQQVIPGAGHMSNLDQPKIFNRTVVRFLMQ